MEHASEVDIDGDAVTHEEANDSTIERENDAYINGTDGDKTGKYQKDPSEFVKEYFSELGLPYQSDKLISSYEETDGKESKVLEENSHLH